MLKTKTKFEEAARGIWDELIKKLSLDRAFIDQVVASGEKLSLD